MIKEIFWMILILLTPVFLGACTMIDTSVTKNYKVYVWQETITGDNGIDPSFMVEQTGSGNTGGAKGETTTDIPVDLNLKDALNKSAKTKAADKIKDKLENLGEDQSNGDIKSDVAGSETVVEEPTDSVPEPTPPKNVVIPKGAFKLTYDLGSQGKNQNRFHFRSSPKDRISLKVGTKFTYGIGMYRGSGVIKDRGKRLGPGWSPKGSLLTVKNAAHRKGQVVILTPAKKPKKGQKPEDARPADYGWIKIL